MSDHDLQNTTRGFEQRVDCTMAAAAQIVPKDLIAPLPQLIGRYRVERVLGQGGFGLVFLAQDELLSRFVAIKVPHRRHVGHIKDAEPYLTEARTVASLDHPHIVPVFDVGSTEEFPCFVVSKYIDGSDLATILKQFRLSIHEAVELVATVAEALHHAHKKGLVHRDIKPGNLLLDNARKPYVADFGLALREQIVDTEHRYAGTPAYMSPEQARGEGHRVDSRSDLFSLGVVLYELLVGKRPFRGNTQTELLEQVMSYEPRPPRQYDDQISKELDRICLKALSKRASDRYSTSQDMADDLRQFIAGQNVSYLCNPVSGGSISSAITVSGQPLLLGGDSGKSTPSHAPSLESQPIKIVPKGLRSFDAPDADFFLELLPGPRDREGLPDSIRFWKALVEETDADHTFSVGLIYGPSGCGKSSLVKAGLLPRFSNDLISVYLEATAEETEARLLNGLRKRCPALPENLSLKDSLATLRRGSAILSAKKVVIILDQFEQWLHANKNVGNSGLVQALRQCDGGRVQCIVMVRDDFWMAVTRFLGELEIELFQGRNCAVVDLFDIDHARKVLTALGWAFGKLPESSREMSKDQKEFLKQAVSGLAREGKVVCVRLALFADMMKGKAWTLATLKEVGGTEGIGVAFLEETFSSQAANPKHRLHQKAAREVLRALLPESDSDIKGYMRSHAELLDVSGYSGRASDFDELIRILDSEIRLITPTDPEGKDDTSADSPTSGEKYYQLTHDYLVHSLRDWLTRKQKETRRGRAELLLADCAGIWTARPENRHLPSLLQWLRIRWLTALKNWTAPQRQMMAKAGRYHAVRGLAMVAVLVLVCWRVYELQGSLKAHALRDWLLDANIVEVPSIVHEAVPYRRWLNPLLYDARTQARSNKDLRKQLNTGLALLPVDATQVDYLTDRLVDAEPDEVPVIRDALFPHKNLLRDKLWAILESTEKAKEKQQLRAAAALASYDVTDQNEAAGRWQSASKLIADELIGAVQKNPSHFSTLVDQLRPIRTWLLPRLTEVFGDKQRADSERLFATSILADYAADRPQILADLVMEAEAKQFSLICPKLNEHGSSGHAILRDELDKRHDLAFGANERETLAKRQANAALALWQLDGSVSVLHLLKHCEDPTVRSYLIHRIGHFRVADASEIMELAAREPDVTIRRALISCTSEFKVISMHEHTALVDGLLALFEQEADAGIHAAAGYALESLGEAGKIEAAVKKLRVTEEQIKKRFTRGSVDTPLWYINGQDQTMVVIRGPVQFVMGSPESESGRESAETQHIVRINRTIAIGARAVTVGEFLRFQPMRVSPMVAYLAPDEPATMVSWVDAAIYCNRLSRQEGIPPEQWCFEIDEQENVTGLRPNYLKLTGYRLPTEAEMEFAARANSSTKRFFGEPDELLASYAWYVPNSAGRIHRAGSLRPNDFGLFDVHGNAWNWCLEKVRDYPQAEPGHVFEDKESDLDVDSWSRVLRGGCYTDHAIALRCAHRWATAPTFRSNLASFRVCRTIFAE